MSKEETYALLRQYKARVDGRQMLARYGAHSMGIGRKISDGEVTDELALRIYVTKKRVSSELAAGEEVPGTITFQPDFSERRRRLTTDIIETPMARFEPVDPKANIRPVPGGVSCGTPGHTGTIGGWVWDTTDDSIVMLSNDHVYFHTPGVDIIQRGSYDGGSTPADKIGDVKRGIPRSTTTNNIVDCAIGDPDSSAIYDLRVLEIGPAVYAIDVGVEDMLVEKFGRTTEHTYGEITDADWEGYIDGIYYFVDCLRVDARAPSPDWSDGGDSGSLVFSRTPAIEDSDIKPVVGLHFAGGGTHGIECKIQNVFNQLQLTTLCAGSFETISDSLFETGSEALEDEPRLERLAELAALRATRFSPITLARKERDRRDALRFRRGISRDMQKRLKISKRGRLITEFVDVNRAELLTMFAKDGDVRRSMLAAIRPLVAGAMTTSEVLERKVSKDDIERLERLGKELARKGGPRLQKGLEQLRRLKPDAGVTMARALEIDL
jgi:hypothetical protein